MNQFIESINAMTGRNYNIVKDDGGYSLLNQDGHHIVGRLPPAKMKLWLEGFIMGIEEEKRHMDHSPRMRGGPMIG